MLIKWLIGRKISDPRIIIESELSVRFEPSRSIQQISIYNQKLEGFWSNIFKREELECWIEVDFIVEDEIPSIYNKAACFFTEPVTLKANSFPYEFELISKISGEVGFHIKRPSPETLMTNQDVLVYVLVENGRGQIIARGIWAISDKGKQSWDLDFERLE